MSTLGLVPSSAAGRAEMAIATSDIRVPYLTRLRTRVLAEHLNQDLELTPSVASANISNTFVTSHELNYPTVDCGDDSAACALGAGRNLRTTATPLLLGLAVLLAVRIRIRRRL